MRSSFGSLNTVVRGLYAQQAGLDTVGHNIANASTEGFSRQTVNLATTRPGVIYGAVGAMQIGTGVDITSITRARDVFMDKQMWKENSTLGYTQTAETTLGKIENVFRDQLPDIGIQAALNKFWNTLQTLATTASNDSARAAVREQADAVVNTMKQAEGQLKNLIADINSALDLKVKTINQIASEIHSLNGQISRIELGGRDNANDLRDRRDLLIDQLSGLVETRVYEDRDHNYIVQTGSVTLVGANDYTQLEVAVNADAKYNQPVAAIFSKDSGQQVDFQNGELGAMLDGIASSFEYLDNLDDMAQFFLKDFNRLHRDGYGTNDIFHDINFFDSKVLGTDPDTNYDAYVPPAYSGGWLSQLKVSRSLYLADGLERIAAKTLPGTAPLVASDNINAGLAAIGGLYTSDKANYTLEIQAVDAAGQVTALQYDDGTGFKPAVSLGGTPPVFQLSNGLTAQIAADPDNAAGNRYSFAAPLTQGNASGDNAVKLANSLKQQPSATLKNMSLDEYYAGEIVGKIGIAAQNTKRLAENQKVLVDQIKMWRESVSGVNVDEEMTNMIRFQKGYNAASRVVTAIDEMLDKLINATGVVGR
ncbi:MAG: flagellar hook-associated protein FlgK [Negativicutes bacterium]|nr:flagellar hook-associated protein FlgK [Negativicutes bacterium]